jgi:Fe-S oxidoreductase
MRQLPKLSARAFSRRLVNQIDSHAGREVILFHDTFMEHYEPEIGEAAFALLRAAGFRPRILRDRVCCGRPAVSAGLLGQAKTAAEHNLALLAPYAARGVPILGCEPSCLSMLVDEYLALVPGEQAAQVAGMTMLLEDFMLRELRAGRADLELESGPDRIRYHGHCQQKALFGTQGPLGMLERIPGCEVDLIESGCCGMAGSFGYEVEHYDLSVQLAEMSLAPAVRAVGEHATICASGASCREQILHTTGREARHPVEVLAAALPAGRLDQS